MRIASRVIGGVLAVTLLSQLTACGSIFYPDRRGQIDGKIDPAIAVLDAVGLLFYVIPGLIAFGVDFATGAIYFEPGKTAQVAPEKLQRSHRRRRQGRQRQAAKHHPERNRPHLAAGRPAHDPVQGQRAATGQSWACNPPH